MGMHGQSFSGDKLMNRLLDRTLQSDDPDIYRLCLMDRSMIASKHVDRRKDALHMDLELEMQKLKLEHILCSNNLFLIQ